MDIYNPKTVRPRWEVSHASDCIIPPLPEFIRSLKDIPVYGTFLDGENMYGQPLSKNGLIVMGNEGNGIGKEVEALINRKLYIPNYPASRETSESLNVAIATAVVCAEFPAQAALISKNQKEKTTREQIRQFLPCDNRRDCLQYITARI